MVTATQTQSHIYWATCMRLSHCCIDSCWSTASSLSAVIVRLILEKEDQVLKRLNEVDKNTQAAVLGAPLEAAYNMYTQLQTS